MGSRQDEANSDFGTLRTIADEKGPSFDSSNSASGEITTGGFTCKPGEVTMPVSFMYVHEL